MSLTDAQKKANKKYQQEKLDEIKLRVPKGEKERRGYKSCSKLYQQKRSGHNLPSGIEQRRFDESNEEN